MPEWKKLKTLPVEAIIWFDPCSEQAYVEYKVDGTMWDEKDLSADELRDLVGDEFEEEI